MSALPTTPPDGFGVTEKRRKAGRRARRRGGEAENEVVKLAQAHGFDQARRSFGSGRNGGGDVLGIPGVSVEVKRVEKLNVGVAYAQAERDARPTDTPVLAHKRNNGPWLATLSLDELLPLLRLREVG